jgi:amino acid permease
MTLSKPKKLFDTILMAMMVVLLIIGIHQTYVVGQAEGFRIGFLKSYWIFMFLLVFFAIFQMRKNKAIREAKENNLINKKTAKNGSKSN